MEVEESRSYGDLEGNGVSGSGRERFVDAVARLEKEIEDVVVEMMEGGGEGEGGGDGGGGE